MITKLMVFQLTFDCIFSTTEEGLGLKVDRAYCNTFVTSLEMAGLSITLLHLNDTFTRCLGKTPIG